MTNFEKITASPEALGEFLASLPVATGPWDEEFHRAFCDSCGRENCDGKCCPHKAERNNPLWWLNRAAGEQVERHPVWRNGMLNLEPGAIVTIQEKEAAPTSETQERQETGKTVNTSERELLICRYESMVRRYERRLAKLKAGASPGDVIF